MTDLKIITELLQRYSTGAATPAEQELIEHRLQENELADNEWPPNGSAAPRSMPLSEVLKVMELSGIQCRIDGRKIIIES